MTDREKVKVFNSYLCDLLEYEVSATSTESVIFSEHSSPVKGRCANYAGALSFICDAAGIPCIQVSSHNHTWNEVYVDGQWLVVDVTANDASTNKNACLLTARAPGTDISPNGTYFAKELLVPGSTGQ